MLEAKDCGGSAQVLCSTAKMKGIVRSEYRGHRERDSHDRGHKSKEKGQKSNDA
jgi:hypothetical protein